MNGSNYVEETLVYDAAGNLTDDGVQQYIYRNGDGVRFRKRTTSPFLLPSPYGSETVTLTLSGLPRHTWARVNFQFAAFDDPEVEETFTINADGNTLTGGMGLGGGMSTWYYGNSDPDAFQHQGDSMTITIDPDGFSEESKWGVRLVWVHTYLPHVWLSGSGTAIEDGSGDGKFMAHRNDPGSTTIFNTGLTVKVQDAGGSAMVDVDYEKIEQIGIPTGSNSGETDVLPIDDASIEGVETVGLSIVASTEYALLVPPSALPTTNPATQIANIDDNRCNPDVTHWFLSELNAHASFWRGMQGSVGVLLRPFYFQDYALNIPYKWMDFNGDDEGNCVSLCNICIDRSELGNIVYGAIGKLWLRGEELIIGAAVALGANGPDSKEDMAGIVAGMTLGEILQVRDVTHQELCAALTGDHSEYINTLESLFVDEAKALLESLGTNLLNDMHGACESCEPATFSYVGPNSDFSWIQSTADLAGGDDDWSQTYPQFPIDWP